MNRANPLNPGMSMGRPFNPAESIDQSGMSPHNTNTTTATASAQSNARAQQEEAAKTQREKLAVYNQSGKIISFADSAEEAEFLREVVYQSAKHGKEIEAAIEFLSEQLRKKTVECEGLRSLAQENYDPVRRAVRREYEARVSSESRQQHQQRALMTRIEELQAERQTLQQEVQSLKALVNELERQPPPSNYNEFDSSLFNRVAYSNGGDDHDDQQKNSSSSKSKGAKDDPNASWNLGNGGSILNAPKHQTQRDVLSGLSGIDSDVAKALEAGQVFDFVKALLVRMCTRLPNGAFPDLTGVITSLLRERRADPNSLARNAAQPIPVAEVSDRQRVTQLYLANNPGQLQQLEMLLSQYQGREGELYEILRDRFYSEDGKAAVANALGTNKPVISSTLDASGRPQAISTDPATELHARIMLMYKKYNPAKLASKDLNVMLSKYPPEILLSALVEKYGPEPSPAEKRELLRSLVEPVAA
jgi:hypothetical protein